MVNRAVSINSGPEKSLGTVCSWVLLQTSASRAQWRWVQKATHSNGDSKTIFFRLLILFYVYGETVDFREWGEVGGTVTFGALVNGQFLTGCSYCVSDTG